MKNIAFCLLFMVGLGCRDKCKNLDLGFAQSTQIKLNFFSKATGEPLIKDANSLLSKADIKVFDEQQQTLQFTFDKVVSVNSGSYYYQVVIEGIKYTTGYNKEICTKLYVDLKNDRDTLGYCYSVKSTICGGSEVEYLNAKYNGLNIERQTGDNLVSYEYKILK